MSICQLIFGIILIIFGTWFLIFSIKRRIPFSDDPFRSSLNMIGASIMAIIGGIVIIINTLA